MLPRNKDKHYVVKEGPWFLQFEQWHDDIIDIRNTDIDYASHFKTEDDARALIKTISYPRRIMNYEIVRCD